MLMKPLSYQRGAVLPWFLTFLCESQSSQGELS